MKNLIIIALSVFGFSCKQTKQEENYNTTIDFIAKSTPLMQPYLCLTFSREYCDSIRSERELKLNEYAETAKTIIDKNKALDYFMSKVSEIREDVSMDYTRALNESLSRQ